MKGFWNGFEKRAAIAAGGNNGLVSVYIHKFPLRNEEEKSKYRRAGAAAGGLAGGIISMPLGALIGTIHNLKQSPSGKGGGKAALKGCAIAALLGGALGGGLSGYQAMRESNKGFGTTHSTHSPEDAKLKAEKYHKPFFKTIMGMGDED